MLHHWWSPPLEWMGMRNNSFYLVLVHCFEVVSNWLQKYLLNMQLCPAVSVRVSEKLCFQSL